MNLTGLKREDISILDKQLKLNKLVFPQNITIFDLLLYVSKNINNSSLLELGIDSFSNIDEKNISSNLFSKICYMIKKEFIKVKDEEFLFRRRNISKLILKVFIAIKSIYINFTDDEILSFNERLFDSKLKNDNYEILLVLLCCNDLIRDNKKRDIIMDCVFNGSALSDVSNLSYSNFLGFVTRKEITEIDNLELFSKIITISLINNLTYYMNTLFDNEKINSKKREIAINYYSSMIDILNKKGVFALTTEINESFFYNIFTVAFCDNLLQLSDEDYERTLNEVLKSKNPKSYSLLLSSNLDEERKNVVKKIIENANEHSIFAVDIDFNKIGIVKLAINDNMKNIDFDSFRRILLLLDSDYFIASDRGYVVDFIMNDYCNGNYKRFLFSILQLCDDRNSWIIKDIYDFCSDSSANSYTDKEYEMIINLIINCGRTEERDNIIKAFTSDRVSSMTEEERKVIFEKYSIKPDKKDDECLCRTRKKEERKDIISIVE